MRHVLSFICDCVDSDTETHLATTGTVGWKPQTTGTVHKNVAMHRSLKASCLLGSATFIPPSHHAAVQAITEIKQGWKWPSSSCFQGLNTVASCRLVLLLFFVDIPQRIMSQLHLEQILHSLNFNVWLFLTPSSSLVYLLKCVWFLFCDVMLSDAQLKKHLLLF